MVSISPTTQRLTDAAMADSSGHASFSFPAAPQGYVLTGTLAVPGAPGLASFNLEINGAAVNTWRGPNPFGPIETNPPEILGVVATGLTAGVTYTAVWQAQVNPLADAPGASPAATLATSVVAVSSFGTNLGTFTVPGGGMGLDFTGIDPTTAAIIAQVQTPIAGPVQFFITGGQTGIEYAPDDGWNIWSSQCGYVGIVPFLGTIDSSFSFGADVQNNGGNPVTVTFYSSSLYQPLPRPAPQTFSVSVDNRTGGSQVNQPIIPATGLFGPFILEGFSWSSLFPNTSNGDELELFYAGSFGNQLWVAAVDAMSPGVAGWHDFGGVAVPFVGGANEEVQIGVPAGVYVAATLCARIYG